ncbi:hypothetical protein M9Y10_025420 [Tritrichomonas musculus]|uniref:Protein kinase domain-containing protein n=1 Tax=Tritrichomonas musculus TaxID=1915356 RepID=A0ABR2H9W1_9EUKA
MIESSPSLAPLISSLPFQKHDYEFLSVIGSGGSSVVFKVKSSKYNDTYFAAKVTPKSFELNKNDFYALKYFTHPYIISIYDYFEDDKNNFAILELCSNGSLASLIKSDQIKSRDDMLFYMKKLTEAIYFCHLNGIAHRDIKPSNVLIDSYGRPKLIDFGICEMLYFNPDSSTNEVPKEDYYSSRKKGKQQLIRKFFGSNPYLSPEIILKESYDPFAADVWSLGVTFYEIATGSLPWHTQSEKVMRDSICQASICFPSTIPKDIQSLIYLMMQVDPSQRPTMKSVSSCSLFQEEVSSIFHFSHHRNSFSGINSQNNTKEDDSIQGQKMHHDGIQESLRIEDQSSNNSNTKETDSHDMTSLALSHTFRSTSPIQKRRRCATLPTPENTSFKTAPFHQVLLPNNK